jgi:hypothetical protein
MFVGFATLFSIAGSAKELTRVLIAENMRSGQTINISQLQPTVINSGILNKLNWGDEIYTLRFFGHDPRGNVAFITLAAITDPSVPTPENWTSFNASDSTGKKYKVLSYLKEIPAGLQVDLDMVYWR